jgi:C4-dicarboxylate transporter
LILIHPANNAKKELKGCIAPVTSLTGIGTGSASRFAFEKLIAKIFSAMKTQTVFLTLSADRQTLKQNNHEYFK